MATLSIAPGATPDSAARTLVEHLFAHRFPPVPGIDIGTACLLSQDDVRVGGDLVDVYQFNNGFGRHIDCGYLR